MSFVFKNELTSDHGKKVIKALAALGKNDPKAFYAKDAGFYGDKIVNLYGKMMDDKDADKEKVKMLSDAMDDWLEVNEEKVNKIWEDYIEECESESEEESESSSECSGSSCSSSSGSKRSHNTPPLKKSTKKAKPSPKKAPKSPKKATNPPKKAPKPPKKAPKSPKSSKSSTSSSSTRKCSNCNQAGHNQVTCPNPTVWPSSDEE